MGLQVAQGIASQRDRWKTEATELSGNPDVLAYFPFEFLEDQPRRLRQGFVDLGMENDGTIVGARWSGGRWPNKHSLDFKRPADRVRIAVPGRHESMTLAAWVRIDGFDNLYNSLLLSEGWSRTGALHWQISNFGSPQLELSVWTGTDFDFTADLSFKPSDFGRWMHLAAVYDGAGGRVSLYRDGSLLKSEIVKTVVEISIGAAQIGNWNPGDWEDLAPIRNLNGRMDELVVFGVALTDDQIERMFRGNDGHQTSNAP